MFPMVFGLAGVVLPAMGLGPWPENLSPDIARQVPALLVPAGQLLAEPGLFKSLGTTLFTGFTATLISLALSFTIVTFTFQSSWWAGLRALLAPVLSIPHVAFAIGFAFLFSPSGWLARLFTPWLTGWAYPPDVQVIQDPMGISLTLAMVFKETPFLLLMSMAGLSQIAVDRQLWIGRAMGYRPHRVWTKVLLPQLYPMIRLPVLAVLAYSLSVVDMAVLLGPNRPPTLAVQVFYWFREPDLALLPRAAAGAALLLAVTLFSMGLFLAAEKVFFRLTAGKRVNGARGKRGRFMGQLTKGYILLGIAVSLGVITALVLWSLTGQWRFPEALPSPFTLFHWAGELPYVSRPVFTALGLAGLSSLLATLLVTGSLEYQRAHDRAWPLTLVCLPLLLPQLSMLFGIQVASLVVGWDSNHGIVLWGHLLFVFPYTYLCLHGSYLGFDERYIQVALGFGRGRLHSWLRVKMPMLIRPLLFSWAVGFSVSIAQFLPTLMLGGGRVVTITTEAVATGSGGDRRLAAIYALIQTVLPALAYGFALALPRLKRVVKQVCLSRVLRS